MDYWARDIYSWGIFSAEVYPRSSIAIQRTAHFLLSSRVNSKNNIFWGSTPAEHCLQRPLHSVKCTAWVAISKHGIIGPFWFEDDNERSVTINPERNVQVHNKFWTALGRRRGVVRVLQWFQQDGAPPLLKRIIGMATACRLQLTGLLGVWMRHGDLKNFIMTHQQTKSRNHFP